MGLRLLQVVRSLRAEAGGVTTTVRHLTAELRARGDIVQLASLDPADAAEPGVHAFGRHALGYGYAAHFTPWLRAHRGEFDAVLVHGLWQYPGLGTWRALRGTDTPYFVFCHGMIDPWFKRTYPLKHAKKWLYWPWAEYRVLRDAAGVLFTCEEERRLARESFWLYRAREQVVPLGVAEPPPETDAQRDAFRAAVPALGAQPYLLFLGRIHPKKGLEELLRGYAATASGRKDLPALVVAGPCADEAYRRQLQALANGLGLDGRVHWLPMLTGAAKWGALHGCAAFVLVSHQENYGLAVVEALACSRPVLLSDQVNLWREITADGAGCAAPDTTAGVAALLARWLALAPTDRAQMARAARRCYKARFDAVSATAALRTAISGTTAGDRSDASSRNHRSG